MSSDAGPHLPLALHQIAINILVRWPILHIIQHKHTRHTNIMTQTLVGRWYCCLTWLEFLVLIQPQWFSLLPPRHFIAAIYICIQTYGWFYHFWSLWYNYGCIADVIIILVNILIVSPTATVSISNLDLNWSCLYNIQLIENIKRRKSLRKKLLNNL